MAHVCDMRAIAERARNQLGLVTTDQLRATGVSRQSERTLLARGALARRSPRVLAVVGFADTPAQHLLVATLEAGEGAVVSHLAACELWRLESIRAPGAEITVPRGRRPRTVPAVVHQARDLVPVDVTRRGPIPVTSPSRSLIDAAPSLTCEKIDTVVQHAARDGLIRPAFLRWRAEQLRRHGRSGAAKILEVVPARPRRIVEESWLETELLQVLARAGLPPPRLQRRLEHSGGRARVDACYDEARLIIEVDGHITHATRRERQVDAERDAHLVAQGWRVVRFTREDIVGRPAYVAGTVWRLLGL